MEYTIKVAGVMETANGRSRVHPGQVVSMTEQDFAHNAHLFTAPTPEIVYFTKPVPDKPKAPEPPLAEIMKPVRQTPKAEAKTPVRSGIKRR
jgi:hypothetical protein